MMSGKNKFKCVIFDCDGVLVDSEKLCCQALVNVFSPYCEEITLNECLANFKGGKISDILRDTIKKFNAHVYLDDIETQYRAQVDQLFSKELKPIAGICELLTAFNEQGIDYCVVSNHQKERVEHLLYLAGLLDHFQGKIFSAFDANSWKPDPDLLRFAAMSMGYAVDECIYIDDTIKGVEAGLNAGMMTIRFHSNEYGTENYSNTYKLEISNMLQLNQIIAE